MIDRQSAEEVANLVFQAATAVIAVSDEVKTYLMNYVYSSKVHVVPNGVNPQRFSALRPATQPETFTVGFVGSLKPWHGLPILTEAFAQLRQSVPNAKLLIVGDGPDWCGKS